jgi:hypothetical protein
MKWIIVGLGNPGEEYSDTRHNAGWMAVEHFAKKHDASEWKEEKKAMAIVAKGEMGKHTAVYVLPTTYMNKSGAAVSKYILGPKMAKNLVVLHDDMDLPLGRIKVSFGKNSGGHRGEFKVGTHSVPVMDVVPVERFRRKSSVSGYYNALGFLAMFPEVIAENVRAHSDVIGSLLRGGESQRLLGGFLKILWDSFEKRGVELLELLSSLVMAVEMNSVWTWVDIEKDRDENLRYVDDLSYTKMFVTY